MNANGYRRFGLFLAPMARAAESGNADTAEKHVRSPFGGRRVKSSFLKEAGMRKTMLLLSIMAASAAAQAQVQVKEPWVRATVPHQTATGAFMQLQSAQDARLVEARSPVAGAVELHEMKMDKDVMRMRPVKSIDIPAGKGAELKPGGYHVMLMGLKKQVKEGESVPLTLVVEGKDGKRQTIEVQAQVRPLNAAAGKGAKDMPMEMKGHGGHSEADVEGVRHAMMSTWDRPDARLTVSPVVISGQFALAGWVQGDRGGRALLRGGNGKWRVTACAGDGLKDSKLLEQAGVPASAARELVRSISAAEAKLPAQHVEKLALFDGWMTVGDGTAHPPAAGAKQSHAMGMDK